MSSHTHVEPIRTFFFFALQVDLSEISRFSSHI